MPRTIQVLWDGVDGSSWDLTDLTSTVQLVSLDGLGMPSFEQQFSASGARDGRRYEGTSYGEATLTLTVSVGDLDPIPGRSRRRVGDEWRTLDREWRKSMSPEIRGTLTIITQSTRRRIRLRLNQPTIIPSGKDPALIGEATYSHVLTADERPWWEGDPVYAQFSQGMEGQPFFGGDNGQTLFYISDDNQLAAATLTNPGDRPSYLMAWAMGPFSSADIGVGTEVVKLPFGRQAFQRVYLDFDAETITDDEGKSLWPLMGFTDPTFAPLQPGESIALVTALVDPTPESAIGVALIPLYEGPW